MTSTGGYECLICRRSFNEEMSFYAHITSHSQEISSQVALQKENQNKENQNPKPYQCSICSKKYKAKILLKWHVRIAHENSQRVYPCDICEKVFSAQERLQRHFSVSHSENIKGKCEICGKSIKKFKMNSHRKSHYLKCSDCDKVFSNKDDLEHHLSKHGKKHECDSCKKCFRSKKTILLHLVKSHLNEVKKKKAVEEKKLERKKTKQEKPFKCDIGNCNYATSSLSLLNAHKFRHDPFYKCVTCQEKFKSRTELKTHMSTHGERPYKCDQCSKCYKDKHGLGWHKKVQHDPSRLKFTCELCGKTYPFDSLLTQHINLTHAVEKQSVCDICGKNVSKTYLPVHRRTHGEKQYSCDVCQKTFLEKAYLKRHKMIHTGEKPYVCNVCGNLFRQHSTLTIHMRTHTGDRPYKCELCDNAYKTHHNLKKHYRRSGHKMV